MEASVSTLDGWNIIAIDGEFVVKHLVAIRQHLEEFEKQNGPRVAFDLTKTTYIDSSAITLMLNFHKNITSKQGSMVVYGATEDARAIFTIVGLDTSVTVYDSRQQFEQAIKM